MRKKNKSGLYNINEIFASLQGEGSHTGTPMVFVRFAGCNRACSFCDTSHDEATPMTASQIVESVLKEGIHTVVFTGGEPAMQLDDALIAECRRAGLTIHVETNGSLPLPTDIDWVVCSPKSEFPGIRHIDELKVLYRAPGLDPDPEHYLELVLGLGMQPTQLSLQPCAAADGSTNLAETIQYVMAHPWWRLSLQTHKMINLP